MASSMSSRRSIRSRVARLRSLSGGELRLLARAFVLLLVADLALRTLSFERARRLLAATPPVPPAGQPPSPSRIAEVIRLVDVAARHHLYPMTCLRRALVLQRLLLQEGLETRLRLGVRGVERRFEAHAWLEHDGIPVGEPEDVALRFAPFQPDP